MHWEREQQPATMRARAAPQRQPAKTNELAEWRLRLARTNELAEREQRYARTTGPEALPPRATALHCPCVPQAGLHRHHAHDA